MDAKSIILQLGKFVAEIDKMVKLQDDFTKNYVTNKDLQKIVQGFVKQTELFAEWMNKSKKTTETLVSKEFDKLVSMLNETSKRLTKIVSDKGLTVDVKFEALKGELQGYVDTIKTSTIWDIEWLKKQMKSKLEQKDIEWLIAKSKETIIDDEKQWKDKTYSSNKIEELVATKIKAIPKRRDASGGSPVFIKDNTRDRWYANVLKFENSTIDIVNNETVITPTWWGGWASSTEITQTWHWFIQTERLYFDETDDTYKKAQSDSVDTLWAWHVVEVIDENTFKIAKEWVHEIPNTLDLWEYVLSQDTAWGYTQTLPWDLWDYVLYWMEVLSSTHISFYTVPAIPVWDTWDWVQSVVAWTWITVDNTDPLNPIINATWGSWTVTSVAISWSDWLEVDSGSPITTTGTIALWVNKTAMLSHLNVEDWADVTDATNVASAWAFMKATDDTDDITEGATNLFMDSTEQGKLANITVTQAVDLDQMEIDIAALANWMVYKWNRDASAWTFPWAWVAQTGRFYTVSVGGTVDSVVFNVWDRLIATTDNASTTTYAWNWTLLDATDAVTSVNGQVWNVVLDPDDLDDSLTTNKFTNSTDIARLANTSWTNTGDQNLSWLVPYTGASWDVDLWANWLTTNDLNISWQTASTIAILDASKNVISASTGTYPSLTELSYGKGVTSAIQTQLNNKQPLDSDLITLAWLTATTNNFIVSVSSAWASRTPAQVMTTLGLATSDSPQFTAINVWHASDTTLSRVSAWVLAVEWVVIPTVSSADALTNKSVNWVTLVNWWTATKYLSEDWTYTTPAWWSSWINIWYSLTWTYVSTSTFTFSWDAWDAEAIERSLFTCLSSADARKIWYVKSASHSAWTVTVTVVTDIDLASWDKTFKVAINRKVEDYQHLFTVPWEQIADASNPQGIFYRSLIDTYLLPVNSFVRTAAAWSGAACAWNVYKWATNLFTSAQDMTTATTFDEKRPNTNTISAWDIITLRVTSSAWATNKASDLQVQAFIVPQTLFTTAD